MLPIRSGHVRNPDNQVQKVRVSAIYPALDSGSMKFIRHIRFETVRTKNPLNVPAHDQ